MKIIISANTSWYLWNFRLSLIKLLTNQGHTVIAVAPEDNYSTNFFSENIAFQKINIYPKSKNPILELKTLFSYFLLYRKIKPDAVLQYTIKPNLYGSIAARILKIHTINNVSGLGAAFEKKGLTYYIVHFLYSFAFKKAARIFFQNKDDQQLFLSHKLVQEEQAALLPGSGVDLKKFHPEQKEKGPITFLFIGRLLKAKVVEDFIDASEIVKNTYPEARFIFLGSHEKKDPQMADWNKIEKAINSSFVIFPGHVDDVKIWIKKADCIVLPSYYREGVPRSLLEAAACGKALIAADSIGTREPVIDNYNGFLCKPKNPESLAEKMLSYIRLTDEERQNFSFNSRKLAESKYDENIILNAYLDIIQTFAVK
jgi:glycosyltransferase involved in cell wall biosynthesis